MLSTVSKLGIIPTRVGTSVNQVSAYDSNEDHPHACGDKVIFRAGFRLAVGSSPRVWGQAGRIKKVFRCERIIPTRVGTRKGANDDTKKTKDHPHACGDKLR